MTQQPTLPAPKCGVGDSDRAQPCGRYATATYFVWVQESPVGASRRLAVLLTCDQHRIGGDPS